MAAAPSARQSGPPSTQASWLVYSGVVACFFLSGLAALLYQTAWLRQFSLVFGTSELAVATVLAAYMGGLALGSAIAGRYAGSITRPVLVYGILEAGIALSALAVPLLLFAARALYAALLGDQPAPPDAAAIGQPVFYLLVAFVVLAIPTAFMGATLPLLIRYAVRSDREVGPRVALFYAINTAGAVVGTVIAAFVLLPALGLMRTVWVGVAVNALVFVIAALLARGRRDGVAPAALRAATQTETIHAGIAADSVTPAAVDAAAARTSEPPARTGAPDAPVATPTAREVARAATPDLVDPRNPSSPTRRARMVAKVGPPGFVAACLRPLFHRSPGVRERLAAVFLAQPGWMPPLMLVSGATAFLYEVLWTRMLAHVIGGSIYAFATMLAAFLTGIALGGGLAGMVARNREQATVAFAFAQVAIGALSMGVYAWMGPLIPDARTTWALTLFAAAVMLPATIFIGATLPLSVRVLARDEHEATAGTARIYAWNTVGAIIGAILAGFVLIPGLGFEGALRVAVGVNFCLALWTAICVAKPGQAPAPVSGETTLAGLARPAPTPTAPGTTPVGRATPMPVAAGAALAGLARPRPVAVGTALAGLAWVLALYSPARPLAVASSPISAANDRDPPREIHYSVGRSSTVMLLAGAGHYDLRTNGLPESSVAVRGSAPALNATKWLTALPAAARPDIRDMLVVGFGGGVALEGVPASVANVDVVELEPEVIEANRRLSGLRDVDPLDDSRFNIVLNDARNALRLTRKSYDAIVSQPSHPWTAGASHLFTREFAADVRRRLNDGGVFLQWMNAEFVDEALLRTLAATLLAEFEHVRLYNPVLTVLMFLASDAPLDIELALARTGRPLVDHAAHFRRLGLHGVEDLLAALAIDEQGMLSFARGAEIGTDDNNLVATRSRFRADGLTPPDLHALFEPYDPLARAGGWVHTQLGGIDYGYLARRLIVLGQAARGTALGAAIPDFSRRFEVFGLLSEATGQADQARESFAFALQADPLNMQARYAGVRNHLDALSQGEAPDDIEEIARGLEGAPAAVIRGLAHKAEADWAALQALDETLAESVVTDAWFVEATRLRAAWRVNAADGRERLAAEALALIERALVVRADDDLHRMRAMGARTLGDDHRLLESSASLADRITARLNAAAASGQALPPDELAPLGEELAAIAAELGGDPDGDPGADLDVADPHRLSTVLENVNTLAQLVDDYAVTE